MFLSLLKFFRGFLLVRLYGYAPERFLNLCSNHDILIWNLINTGEYYEFNISIAGYRKLKPLLKKTKTKIRIIKRSGFPFFLHRYRKRKVFFAGILFCVGLIIYLSRFVWIIDINGNSAITDDTVLTFLKEEQSAFGDRLSEIDCEGLEELLRSQFAEIIWASVQLSGTKMTVDLQENLLTSEGNSSMTGEYDIAADKDAIVNSIITRAGTPLVKAGDTIKKGDILVTGRLDIYDDNNVITNYEYVTSDADILGETTYQYKESFPMKENQKVKTGECKTVYGFTLLDHQLKLPWHKKIEQPYLSVTDSKHLSICQNYYIPVVLDKTSIYLCRYEKIQLSKEQAKERANEKIIVFLKKLQEKGIQITAKNVMIDFINNTCQIQVDISAQEKIGRYAPTEIIKISTDEGITDHESD